MEQHVFHMIGDKWTIKDTTYPLDNIMLECKLAQGTSDFCPRCQLSGNHWFHCIQLFCNYPCWMQMRTQEDLGSDGDKAVTSRSIYPQHSKCYSAVMFHSFQKKCVRAYLGWSPNWTISKPNVATKGFEVKWIDTGLSCVIELMPTEDMSVMTIRLGLHMVWGQLYC